jgi:hypothetical protein
MGTHFSGPAWPIGRKACDVVDALPPSVTAGKPSARQTRENRLKGWSAQTEGTDGAAEDV